MAKADRTIDTLSIYTAASDPLGYLQHNAAVAATAWYQMFKLWCEETILTGIVYEGPESNPVSTAAQLKNFFDQSLSVPAPPSMHLLKEVEKDIRVSDLLKLASPFDAFTEQEYCLHVGWLDSVERWRRPRRIFPLHLWH